MIDKQQLLNDALKKLNQPIEHLLPPTIEEANGSTIDLSNVFTVSLKPIGTAYDLVIFTLTDAQALRACTLQNLIPGITTDVSEGFENTHLDSRFSSGDQVVAQCFLRDKSTRFWVATGESPAYTFA